MKIVIFDLDETLGYFVEFGIFWDCLNKFISENKKPDQVNLPDFNQTLDLFPEFIRPNIIPILNYLKYKKQNKCCNKLLIYTNNQGTELWADKIIFYFEDKIKTKLFDQIISAFKVNGKRLEICRTTHDKTFHDLIKCTKIPMNAEICYLDDTYFPEMANKNVYYIHVKPYVHDLPFEEMINRFEKSNDGSKYINNENRNEFRSVMLQLMNNYQFTCIPKTKEEKQLDKVVSKEIMVHLQYFFKHSFQKNKKTRQKNGCKCSNKTRKR